ncbi:MAG: hypothetical protein EKK41_01420 [Hyphomicrobiales bacterium]|nr:MAG: hypothetical protein EKK41_01420 [Hyphomicrobiales bacterium]
MSTNYELRLIEDVLSNGAVLRFPADGIHRAMYVVHGRITIAGRSLAADEGFHAHGAAEITAGNEGATVWRWELAKSDAVAPAVAMDGSSTRKLTSKLAWPIADAVLMRLDSVSFPPGGCALLHTHQGPGIRCLIDGTIRIDTHGRSTSYGPGSPWFEAGPEPVFAQAAMDRPSRFIRVMILPAHLKGKSSIAYVNAEDRDKPKSQSYKGFVDRPIEV